jgi:hypothetical protein
MVSAVRDSAVYALKFRDSEGRASASEPTDSSVKRAVISVQLDTINKAADAARILREVLGVEATVPEWVEEELTRVVQKYRDKVLTDELLDGLRSDLRALGYSHLYPAALSQMVRPND